MASCQAEGSRAILMGYTPAFDTIYAGTLYGKWPTAAVWASLLPLINSKGAIDFSYEAIAGMTGWPLDLLREGIAELMKPDPGSRSPVEDGRRLVPLTADRPWGWRAVNIQRYRDRASGQDQVSDGRNAEKVRRYKERHRQTPADTPKHQSDTHSYSNTDSDSNKEKNPSQSEGGAGGDARSTRAAPATRLPPDFLLTPERRAIAEAEKADPDREFANFVDHWRSASGQKARKHDWDATWRIWCRRAPDFKPQAKGSGRKTFDERMAALRTEEAT